MNPKKQTAECKTDRTNTLRRDVLKCMSALPLTSVLDAHAATKEIAGFERSLMPSRNTLKKWLQTLHDFGPIRATGTKQCRAFEEWLASEFGKLGFSIERDQFKLTSWECDIKDCAIAITEQGTAPRDVEVIAYYPFAASTIQSGPVSGEILYAGVNEPDVKKFLESTDAARLANAIVVVDMPLAGGGIRGQAKMFPEAFPAPFKDRVSVAPRPASQGGRAEMELLENKCKGIIFCYTDVMDEAARHNYLPFSDRHRKVPALWVGQKTAAYLKTISGKARATLKCTRRSHRMPGPIASSPR